MEKTSNKFITFYKKFGIYVFLVAVVIIFSIIAPNFLSVANLINILRQVSIFGIVVIGVTMVMIGGGMDLSVGGIMAVVGMVMGYCMVNVGLPIPVAVIIGIALGVAFGAINGVVAIKLHIAPIIVTLAMMLVLQGVAYLITGGYPITGMPKAFLTVGQGYVGPVPIPVILFVIFIVFGWIVMNKTYLGRNIYALGGNKEAARLAAYYSSMRGSDKVEIDYVEKKQVKKPNGGKPGFVVYYTNYSMVIDSDISNIEELE